MKLETILRRAGDLQLQISVEGTKLAIRPKGKAPPDFLELLRTYKLQLMDYLSVEATGWKSHRCRGWRAVPPQDLPFVSSCPSRCDVDRERIVQYIGRQVKHQSCPLTSWVMQRKQAYNDGPGETWPRKILDYAACRDAACWQLNRSEAEALELLEAFDEVANRGASGN